MPRDGTHRSSQKPPSDTRSEFQIDYDRIAYSTAFRRLARKTQVHPLADNDHVHTRLTHSIEVSCVGRSLGTKLALFLKNRKEVSGKCAREIPWVLMSACMCHDIGNPPFGHAGENAIRDWVQKNREVAFGTPPHESNSGTQYRSLAASETSKRDFEIFEGNAQSFRLAARTDNGRYGYLRLTYATLGTLVKYPWTSASSQAHKRGKHNVYSTEEDIFDRMNRELGLFASAGRGYRHPMSFLAEVADDICYRSLDLEDAAELGLISPSEVHEIFNDALGENSETDANGYSQTIGQRRSKVIGRLIDESWRVFENHYDDIMNWTWDLDLKSHFSPPMSGYMSAIDELYKSTIFNDRSKVAAELGAHQALGRIAHAVCTSCKELADTGSFSKCGFRSRRCLELGWGSNYATKKQQNSYDWWLHQIMDFLASLTDNYARQLSREIEGT